MTLLFSTDSFRENSKTALHCVQLAELLRRAIDGGDASAKTLDLALYETYESFRHEVAVRYSRQDEAIHRKLFLENHPWLKLVIPAFEEAVRAFGERIVASIPGTQRDDWSMVAKLEEATNALVGALDMKHPTEQPVRMRPVRQARLVAHLDADPPYITLDGEPCTPFDEAATHYVATLIDADGYRVPFEDFLEEHPQFAGSISSRTLDKIPDKIMQFIDRGGKGRSCRLAIRTLQSTAR